MLRKGWYATGLREPIARFDSYLAFRRYEIMQKFRREALDPFGTALIYNNIYAKALLPCTKVGARDHHACGVLPGKSQKACSKAESLLRNSFSIVGTTERLVETFALINYVFNFSTPAYLKRVNVQLGATPILPKEKLKKYRKLFACDQKLYETAKELLDSSISCLGGEFQVYLKRYKESQRKITHECESMCVEYGKPHRGGRQCPSNVALKTLLMNKMNKRLCK